MWVLRRDGTKFFRRAAACATWRLHAACTGSEGLLAGLSCMLQGQAAAAVARQHASAVQQRISVQGRCAALLAELQAAAARG